MSFSSLEFIIICMPVFFGIYYILMALSKRSTILVNVYLLIASLCFVGYVDYKAGTFTNILVLLCEIVINYLLTLSIDYYKNKPMRARYRKKLFWLLVVIDVCILLYYKVFIRRLPIGLSFYTFTMLAYAIDVYRKNIEADRNIINVATYFAMFPKIMQGPITRYQGIGEALKKRKVNLGQVDRALKLFIYGLSCKVIIADRLGSLFYEIQTIGFESISTALAWMGALAYSMQLYFDFMGYTMMAVALGSMLGFRLPKNFDNPYASKTVAEFYRRWHITLGNWFKDYIYIPLGGSRKGMLRTIVNLFVVWLITGFWHGITGNFIIWGIYLFIFIALEKLFIGRWLNKSRFISHIYLWFVILISWVIFAIDNVKRLGIYITRLFPFLPSDYMSNIDTSDYIRYGRIYGPLLVIALLLCIPQIHNFFLVTRRKMFSSIIAAALFVYCLYFVSKGMNNPFMYFVF